MCLFIWQTLDLLMDIFLQNNCLEHMFQVMSYHPKYLECFVRVHQYLMYGDGPLPFSYRHYIAIMVTMCLTDLSRMIKSSVLILC